MTAPIQQQTNMQCGGIVLCGGQSSRMGRPKEWLPFGDEVLLQRVVRLVDGAVSPVVVVAAAHQELPPLPSAVQVLRDRSESRGPLEGLAVGLRAIALHAQGAYVTACDAPLLQPEFIRWMIALLPGFDLVVPQVGGYAHMLSAVYQISLLEIVEQQLAAKRMAIKHLLSLGRLRSVCSQELMLHEAFRLSLFNVNEPKDYLHALAILGLHS